MNEVMPTAAVFAGSLARTFEYCTAGVHQTPQIRWTWTASGRITCPVLVDQGVVYLADDQGSFSALEAASGRVLWRFQAEQQEPSEDRATGITATCLADNLGYIAVVQGLLYEIDLKTGECVHVWDLTRLAGEQCAYVRDFEEDPFEGPYIIYLLNEQLVLIEQREIFRFNRSLVQLSPLGSSYLSPGEWLPTVYSTPEGQPVLFDFDFVNSNESSIFTATLLPADNASPEYDSIILWGYDDDGPSKPLDLSEEVGLFSHRMMPLMDDVLYVFKAREEDDEEKEDGYALLALDPLSGTPHWSIPFPDHEVSQMAAASGLIFLRFDDHIEAFSTQTHEQLWSWAAGARTGHCFIADALLYVFDEQGQMSALDIHTGERRWQWQMEEEMLKQWRTNQDGGVWTNPMLYNTIADGTLYIVAGHTLYALG